MGDHEISIYDHAREGIGRSLRVRCFFWFLCDQCIGLDPVELCLAAQHFKWVSGKGRHDEFLLRLTCGLKRMWLYIGRSAIVSNCTDAIVPDGWHTTVAALIVQASSCCPPCVGTATLIAGCLLFCLQGVADDPLPTMAIAM
jgi:hypothetical protein